MFEAKRQEGYIFKRIVEAIKDLVTDVNLDVSPSGKLLFIVFGLFGSLLLIQILIPPNNSHQLK